MSQRPLVLLVEDDFLVSEEVREDLTRFGCEICDTATTTAEAVASANEHHPSLAVVDVGLRRGDSGIDAATRIREESGAKIIFLTGRSDPDVYSRMRAVRPIAILSKPYDRERLRQAILDALSDADA
jgi:DNA-binding NarL/FixJ family response regulator